MSFQSLPALGINSQPINALGSFNEGAQAGQLEQITKLKQAQSTLETIGGAAMYATGGDPNGEVDPAKWAEVMDGLAASGIDVSQYRDKPQFANVAANASITALQRLQQAHDDRTLEQTMAEFQHTLEQDSFNNNLASQKLAVEQADAAGSGPDETGLQVQYARDADGNPVVLQATKSGKLIRSEMPDGLTIDPGYAAQERKAGGVVGGAQGAAEVALATAGDVAEEISDKVKSIKEDDDLDTVIGSIDANTPNWTERSRRVQSKIDQIKGVAFLQARQVLKGGGAITDYESAKAEAAYIRMEQMVSEEDFKQALDDFNTAVQSGVKKLKAQAALDRQPRGGGSVVDDGEYEIREK